MKVVLDTRKLMGFRIAGSLTSPAVAAMLGVKLGTKTGSSGGPR